MRSTTNIMVDGKTRIIDLTQAALLNAGLRREDGALLPAPDFVSQDLAHLESAIASLVRRGLARMEGEIACISPLGVTAMVQADPHGGPVTCRQALELPQPPERYQLVGFEAALPDPESSSPEPCPKGPFINLPDKAEAPEQAEAPESAGAPEQRIEPAAPSAIRPRRPSKLDLIATMLSAPSGATLEDLTAATGWQPHSVRAGMTGLRKQGQSITRTSVDGTTRFAIAVQAVMSAAA